MITVKENSETGILNSVYDQFQDLQSRLCVSKIDDEEIVKVDKLETHLFQAVFKVNKDDDKYFGNTLVKYYWNVNIKQKLKSLIINPHILLRKNEEIINDYSVLKLEDLILEFLQNNEWKLSVTEACIDYTGSVDLYVTQFKEEEIFQLPVNIRILIPSPTMITVKENSKEGVLASIYLKCPELTNRIYVSAIKLETTNLYQSVIKVNKNDDKYFGNALVKYYWKD